MMPIGNIGFVPMIVVIMTTMTVEEDAMYPYQLRHPILACFVLYQLVLNNHIPVSSSEVDFQVYYYPFHANGNESIFWMEHDWRLVRDCVLRRYHSLSLPLELANDRNGLYLRGEW